MNIPRRALFSTLNATLFRAIESATAFAKLRGNPYVELVHWIHQLWQASGNDLHRVVSHYGLDAAQLEKDLTIALSQLPNGASSINDFSHLIELAVERSWVYASLSMNDQSVRGAWLLAAVLETPELRRALLGISAVFQKIPVVQLAEDLPLVIVQSSESQDSAGHPVGAPAGLPGEASAAFDHGSSGQSALAK
jgi:type VI secretion system protein VasG